MRTALSGGLRGTHPAALRHPSKEGMGKGTHPGPTGHPSEEGSFCPSREGCRSGGWVSAIAPPEQRRNGKREEKRKPLAARRQRFFADRSALGTAIAAAFFTLLGLAGIALAGDHVWLTYQRDLLKTSADAAGLATAYRLPTFGSDMSDEEVKAALDPVARRYILANLPEEKRQQAQDTLELTLTRPRACTAFIDASATWAGWSSGAGCSDLAKESWSERTTLEG